MEGDIHRKEKANMGEDNELMLIINGTETESESVRVSEVECEGREEEGFKEIRQNK